MIAVLLALVPIAALGVWLFVRLPPRDPEDARLRRFNRAVIAVALAAVAVVSAYFYLLLRDSPDRAWWPVLALIGGVIAGSVTLVVGAALRVGWGRQGGRGRRD